MHPSVFQNGSIADVYQLDMLGSLICHLSPNIIRNGIHNVFTSAINLFKTCSNLSHEQNQGIKYRILQHYGYVSFFFACYIISANTEMSVSPVCWCSLQKPIKLDIRNSTRYDTILESSVKRGDHDCIAEGKVVMQNDDLFHSTDTVLVNSELFTSGLLFNQHSVNPFISPNNYVQSECNMYSELMSLDSVPRSYHTRTTLVPHLYMYKHTW